MTKTDSKARETQTLACEVVGTESPDQDQGVDVLVEFCHKGNYHPVAADLARAIVDEFDPSARFELEPSGVHVRLVPVRDGRFEVHVDGRLIFSKRATNRLPEADEIFYHVAVARQAFEKRLTCAV